jgi:PAS domain S-box-containing protein
VAAKTILVVEHDGKLAQALTDSLLRLGYRVLAPATTGEAALAAVVTHAPHLVLLDAELPGPANVSETAARIRRLADIPVILLTGAATPLAPATAVESDAFEACTCLAKPAPDEELAATLTAALRRHHLDRRLREREEDLRTLIANVPGAVYRCGIGAPWRVSQMSEGVLAITGYPAHEFLRGAVTFGDIILNDDLPEVERAVATAMGDRRPFSIEYRIRHADGQVRWVQDTGRCPQSADHRAPYLDGVILDITDRKRAEQARLDAHAELAALYSHVPVAILLVDSERRVIKLNDAAGRFGDPEIAAMGRRAGEVLRCLHSLDDPHGCGFGPACGACPVRRTVAETFADRRSREMVDATLITGNVEHPVERRLLISTAYLDSETGPNVLVACQDITRRKRAEETLESQRAELHAIYENAPVMMCALSTDWRLLGANRAFAESGEIARGVLECVGALTGGSGCLHGPKPEDCALGQALLSTLRTGSPRRHVPWRMAAGARGNRRDIVLLASVASIPLAGETRLLVCLTDVTEREEAQRSVRDAEERYRTLVENAGEAVLVVQNGVVQFANPMVEAITGRPRDQIVGTPAYDLIHPDDRAMVLDRYWRRVGGHETPRNYSFRVVRPSGEIRLANLNSVLISWNGAPATLTFLSDITDRLQLETDYQTLLESMLDGFAVHELIVDESGAPVDYRFLSVNPAFQRLTGLRAEDVIGRTVREVLPSLSRYWAERCAQVASTGKPARFEHYVSEIGKWFEVFAYCPRPRRFATVFQDITERRGAAEALSESEARYRSLVENTPDTILRTDRQFRHIFVSPAVERITGLKAAECFGKTFRSAGFTEEQACAWEAMLEKTFRAGIPQETEVRFDSPLGPLVLDWRLFPERDASGSIQTVLSLLRDITGDKRAADQNARLKAQLEQAQRLESIGRLAGGVAHDFNNLLTVINGYCQLSLSEPGLNDELRMNLEEILSAGVRASGLTKQLLAFSRKQVLDPRVVDLNEVVAGMRSLLGRIVGEDVELMFKQCPEPVVVLADAGQLGQVIMNLAVNARDAMPDGGTLLIETAGVEFAEGGAPPFPGAHSGRYALLSAADNGVGMDEETVQRIFDPFFTTKETGKGTGLGLSMVQGIVAQSGGYVGVESQLHRGARFNIYLPRLDADIAPRAQESAAARGEGELILVVEDQAEVRQYTAAALKAYGYRVLQAESGVRALALCEEEVRPIDLVLTDMVMPNISGMDLAVRLRTLRPGIRVLFMSGYTSDPALDPQTSGAQTPILRKPFSPAQLAVRVREALEAPPARARVLVADDEAGIRRFLRKTLEDAGYDVVEASNGKQALEQALSQSVDLVITDLVMPEQEGIETIQALRSHSPRIAIIAMSGAFGGQFLDLARLLGAHGVLKKPLSVESVLEKVSEVLKARPR